MIFILIYYAYFINYLCVISPPDTRVFVGYQGILKETKNKAPFYIHKFQQRD